MSLTVKFTLSPTIEINYRFLVEGGTETFINRIKVHKIVMADCKVKKEAVVAQSLMLTNWRKILALIVADPATNRVEIDNRIEANCELAETVCTLQIDAFYYLEKLLSPALVVK